MFSAKTRRGKVFAAEQKIRELKKILLKSKIIEKRSGKRVTPNELIKKAKGNLNKTHSAKYGFRPNQREGKKF